MVSPLNHEVFYHGIHKGYTFLRQEDPVCEATMPSSGVFGGGVPWVWMGSGATPCDIDVVDTVSV